MNWYQAVAATLLGGPLPDTDGGYLISVIVGVVLIIGGIILLRLQRH